MTAKVTVKDRGSDEMMARLRALSAARVRVGVLGSKASAPKRAPKRKPKKGKRRRRRKTRANPASVALIAAAHEFGLGVPLRSWLRSPIDALEADYRKMAAKLVRQVYDGKIEPDVALERLGLWLVGELKKRMSAGLPVPPLKPETIRRKGSSKPLIDTGQTRSAITHEVIR